MSRDFEYLYEMSSTGSYGTGTVRYGSYGTVATGIIPVLVPLAIEVG